MYSTPDLGTPMYSKIQLKVIKPMSPVKDILIAYGEDHKNNASMFRNHRLHPDFFFSFLDKFNTAGRGKPWCLIFSVLFFPTGPMIIILKPCRELSVFQKLARRVNQSVQPCFHVISLCLFSIRHNPNTWMTVPKGHVM